MTADNEVQSPCLAHGVKSEGKFLYLPLIFFEIINYIITLGHAFGGKDL
jgi:hypothetical protein